MMKPLQIQHRRPNIMAAYKKEYFGIARKIVSNMTSESWEQIPHVTMNYEADVTAFMDEYQKLNEGNTDKMKKITFNTVIMKVICEGLMAAPKMNCTLKFNRKLVRGTLVYHDNVDISMPTIIKTGEMMTLTLHDMQNKSLTEMTESINDTLRRANNSDMNEVMYEVSLDNTLNGLKNGKIAQTLERVYGSKMPGHHMVHNLSGEKRHRYYSISKKDRLTKNDIEQGTTTISNWGSVHKNQSGNCCFLVIVPPQVTTFAINAVQKRPTVVTDENGNDKIEIRYILPLTVAFDHRALDYGDCVPFFEKLDEIFSNASVIQSWK